MRVICFIAVFAAALWGDTVIDRIVVVVQKHAIKASDIDRDLRLTDFLNKASLNSSPAERKASEERLIDQQLIRAELPSGNYARARDQDADSLLQQIRHDRYGGSDPALKQALAGYGLTEEQLRAQLLWQLTVLAFINERFRAGVLVSDDDVRTYYEQHRGAWPGPLDSKVTASVREVLEGQQVNQEFEAWLAETRRDTAIEYKTEAP